MKKLILFLMVLTSLQSGADESWIYPVQDTRPTIPEKSELLLVQAAELAIWEGASKEFVMRQILPGIIYPGDRSVRVYSIIPIGGGEYSREVVEFELNDQRQWVVAKKEVVRMEKNVVEKCHSSFKRVLLSVKHVDRTMGGGPDEAIVNWECSLGLEGRGKRMQATQFGVPKADKDLKMLSEITDVLRGPM